MDYQYSVAIFIILMLRQKSEGDSTFQYNICFEKIGYGKFDDIVVKLFDYDPETYTEICFQTKHSYNNSTITAKDFLDPRNKGYGFLENAVSADSSEYKSEVNFGYHVMVSNRAYEEENEIEYFNLLDTNGDDNFLLNCLGTVYKLQYHEKLNSLMFEKRRERVKIEKELDLRKFCNEFRYISNTTDINSMIRNKILEICKGNEYDATNLHGRLHLFVVQNSSYQNSTFTKIEVNEIFDGNIIRFNLPDLDNTYCIPDEYLKNINEALMRQGRNRTNILEMLVVTGNDKADRTQLVRKYIQQESHKYSNIFWFDATDEDSLQKSLCQFTTKYEITSFDTNESLENNIKALYPQFIKDTLYIFDNASNFLADMISFDEYSFLPNKNDIGETVKFIIISSSKEWDTKNIIEFNYKQYLYDNAMNSALKFREMEQYREALEMYNQALLILIKDSEPDQIKILQTIQCKAKVFESSGQYDEALSSYQEVLQGYIDMPGHYNLTIDHIRDKIIFLSWTTKVSPTSSSHVPKTVRLPKLGPSLDSFKTQAEIPSIPSASDDISAHSLDTLKEEIAEPSSNDDSKHKKCVIS